MRCFGDKEKASSDADSGEGDCLKSAISCGKRYNEEKTGYSYLRMISLPSIAMIFLNEDT